MKIKTKVCFFLLTSFAIGTSLSLLLFVNQCSDKDVQEKYTFFDDTEVAQYLYLNTKVINKTSEYWSYDTTPDFIGKLKQNIVLQNIINGSIASLPVPLEVEISRSVFVIRYWLNEDEMANTYHFHNDKTIDLTVISDGEAINTLTNLSITEAFARVMDPETCADLVYTSSQQIGNSWRVPLTYNDVNDKIEFETEQ